jgi:molybdate-binding protein
MAGMAKTRTNHAEDASAGQSDVTTGLAMAALGTGLRFVPAAVACAVMICSFDQT